MDHLVGLFQYDFLRHAVLAGTIVAITAGALGYFVVLRQLSFAAHALAHIGFSGATGAVWLGLNLVAGMVAFTVAAAIGIGALGDRLRGRDVAIGTVLAFVTGLGYLFVSQTTRLAGRATSILFGDLLAISAESVVVTAVLGALSVLVLGAIYRPLLFASVDPAVAATRGVPVRLVGIGFLILLAITVSTSVQVVGVLLIFALLVTPAATAQRLTAHPGRSLALSVVFAVVSVWAGLVLAVLIPWPPSFFITAVSFAIYLLVVWRVPSLGSPIARSSRRTVKPPSRPARDSLPAERPTSPLG
ncbi:MAG: ABC transporter permease [Dehalococcoidia bacterium]|nr:MAG: ABC transporter permease [Dehalococcoidia bacterium]